MNNLLQTIQNTRNALHQLRTDEAELTRLHAELTDTVQAMHGSGSKDFTALAEHQGRQAALKSMLDSSQNNIQAMETQLQTLEAQQQRSTQLQEVARIAQDIRNTREQLHIGVMALSEALKGELGELFELHAHWSEMQQQWRQRAKALGVILDPYAVGGQDSQQNQRALALWLELEGQGIDTEALRFTFPPYMPEVRGSQRDTLPLRQVPLAASTPYPDRFETLFAAFFTATLTGWHGNGRTSTIPPPLQPTAKQPENTLLQAMRGKLRAFTTPRNAE